MMFKTEEPAGSNNLAAILDQVWENDKLNRALNDAAVLITGLTRGKIVSWSATNSRWELYDGTVTPDATTMIGIVEYVGSPDTSGGVRVTGVFLDDTLADNTAYYCQSNGTLGTTETATFIGVCTDAGRLVMQGRGGGGSGSGASIGTGNYIAEPFSVVPGTGLEVLVNPNRCVIDETVVESTSQTAVALTGKAAQLIYKKKDGTYDKLLPAMTASDLVDANTVGLWFPDGSATVPNAAVGVNGNTLAVANALAKSGTITAVDGWAGGDAAKGDGSTGCYTSANSIGFPTGAAVAELGILVKINSVASEEQLAGFGSFSSNTNTLGLFRSGTGINRGCTTGNDLGYAVESDGLYLINLQYDGANVIGYFGGRQVYKAASSFGVTASVLNVLRRGTNDKFATATIHFVELRNALRTPAQIATMAQKLLIPCSANTGFTMPVMTADNAPSPYTVTATTCATSQEAYKACDGNLTTYYQVNNVAFPVHWTIDFGTAKPFAGGYTVGTTSYNLWWSDWELRGSNDGFATYDVLDSRSGISFVASEQKYFMAQRTSNYKALRIYATAGNSTAAHLGNISFDFAPVQTDIRNALDEPAESQIIAYAETSATGPKVIIDSSVPKTKRRDRAYGIMVGPSGIGNEEKFSGWEYKAAAALVLITNPFDSNRVDAKYYYAEDAAGRNMVEIPVSPDGTLGYKPTPTPAHPLAITLGSSGIVFVGGAWKTAGYIGAMIRTLDKGVN